MSHGTAVLAGAHGILIRGASGSGKSSLALALIERGARLVADDQVYLAAREGRVLATAPFVSSGMIEQRGRGIAPSARERAAVIRLIVDIVGEGEVERMPETADLSTVLCGITLPRQPVTADIQRAVQLVRAALAALSPHCNMSLRPGRVWGMMAIPFPHMAVS